MIVDPDFPDHWKTRMLVDLLDGDEAAPVYLIRLWAHCQNRKTSTFALPSAALKALCRFPGHANKLESSLAASGFVRREGDTLIVCGWSEYNASLIANWENGKLGGRPPKNKPDPNPPETHGKPMGNPRATHPEPIGVEEIDRKSVSAQAQAKDTSSEKDPLAIVQAYPRKESLAEALNIVRRQLDDGEDYEAMLAGTRACAAVIRTLPSGPLNRYVPSAETFFRKMKWKDDPDSFRRQGNTATGQGQMSLEEARKLLGGRAAALDD